MKKYTIKIVSGYLPLVRKNVVGFETLSQRGPVVCNKMTSATQPRRQFLIQ